MISRIVHKLQIKAIIMASGLNRDMFVVLIEFCAITGLASVFFRRGETTIGFILILILT